MQKVLGKIRALFILKAAIQDKTFTTHPSPS